MQSQELERIARQIRLRDVQAVFEAGAGHVGGEMSAIDIMTALYFRVLRIWPDDPKNPTRDRFVLSKGHTACALYVTLAKRGFIPEEEISTFLQPNSRLNGHPNCNKVPGVVIPDALAKRMQDTPKARWQEEGMQICIELIQQIREIEGVAGVHVMAYRQEEYVAEMVHDSGVLKGRRPWQREPNPVDQLVAERIEAARNGQEQDQQQMAEKAAHHPH